MPPTDGATPPPDRSRQIYVYWAVGLAFLAALALFCWLVVGPVLEARQVIVELKEEEAAGSTPNAERAVETLGGSRSAAAKLAAYLRAPDRFAPDKHVAVWALRECGHDAITILSRIITDKRKDPDVRGRSLLALGHVAGQTGSPRAIALLIACLDDPDKTVKGCAAEELAELTLDPAVALKSLMRSLQDPVTRARCARALGRMGPSAREAIPELEKALAATPQHEIAARETIAEVLKRLRAEESPPPPGNQSSPP